MSLHVEEDVLHDLRVKVGGTKEKARYYHIIVRWEIVRQQGTVYTPEYYLFHHRPNQPVPQEHPEARPISQQRQAAGTSEYPATYDVVDNRTEKYCRRDNQRPNNIPDLQLPKTEG